MEYMIRHWQVFALITGMFWGIIAATLHTPPIEAWKDIPSKRMRHIKQAAAFLTQFAFNFVGGFAGWCFLMIATDRPNDQFGGVVLILYVLAVLGISGKLSAILWEIPEAIKDMFKRMGGKVS